MKRQSQLVHYSKGTVPVADQGFPGRAGGWVSTPEFVQKPIICQNNERNLTGQWGGGGERGAVRPWYPLASVDEYEDICRRTI